MYDPVAVQLYGPLHQEQEDQHEDRKDDDELDRTGPSLVASATAESVTGCAVDAHEVSERGYLPLSSSFLPCTKVLTPTIASPAIATTPSTRIIHSTAPAPRSSRRASSRRAR